jgi:AcrR family transcriptional regulator
MSQEAVIFRRATAEDALVLAREMFLAGERVDLAALASRLGVSRATLHRWVGTRERLLDRVLGDVGGDLVEAALPAARAAGADAVPVLARTLVADVAGSEAMRAFAAREPDLALRLLLGDDSTAAARVRDGVRGLLAETGAVDDADRDAAADAITEVGIALAWSALAAGVDPSPDRAARIVRALLAGAARLRS